MSISEPSLSLSALDLGYLGQFAGQAYNAAVLAALDAAGLEGLRSHHGYIVMHLLRGPMRLGELAPLLGVTQQAVSKSVRELVDGGFVLREHSAADARVVMLELSARGVAAASSGLAAFPLPHGDEEHRPRSMAGSTAGGRSAVRRRPPRHRARAVL